MHDDYEWKAAEEALEKARRLPNGPERIQALKEAGKLRFEADKRRHKKDQRHPGRASRIPELLGKRQAQQSPCCRLNAVKGRQLH
jgi:hypothetical protein